MRSGTNMDEKHTECFLIYAVKNELKYDSSRIHYFLYSEWHIVP